MESETQALHLSQMMQKHLRNPQYELALPFVRIRRSTLKKLSMKDIMLLEMDALEFILLEGDVICADLTLQRVEESNVIVVKHLQNKAIVPNENSKYKTIKLSLGKCQMKSLGLGKSLELTQFDLEKITLVSNEKKIAEGSLVNVENALAIQINTLY